jgi:hypothetical protein
MAAEVRQDPDGAERPAIWRRIRLTPGAGAIQAELEDNFHRFRLTLRHSGGFITGIDADPQRYPWSTCTKAAEYFIVQMLGRTLTEAAAIDPSEHCTHLMDLLALCAVYAGAPELVVYDLRAGEPEGGRKWVALRRNGAVADFWRLEGTRIMGEGVLGGRDLRQLSTWRSELDPQAAAEAHMMRRVALMADQQANVREVAERLVDVGAIRMGACFTYQMPRALEARYMNSRRSFTPGTNEPLPPAAPGRAAR